MSELISKEFFRKMRIKGSKRMHRKEGIGLGCDGKSGKT